MQLSSDLSHHFELLRLMGHTYFGGADVQEVLQVAGEVKAGDDEGWFVAFDALARRVREAGNASLRNGHVRSASQSYLRASMYYMFADFYLHADKQDPRIRAAGRSSRECFVAAIPGLDYTVRRVEIPYENATLPGYVMQKKGTPPGPRQTMICHSGFDGTKEEVAIWPGMGAAQRGYTVIVFDGPGQGEVIRESGRVFRADWDKVVSPVVDFALTLEEVDAKRIALHGISMGGVLAPLAAAKEHRLKAMIANGGLYSYHEILRGRASPEVLADPQAYNAFVAETSKKVTTFRWAVNHGMYSFGGDTPAEYFERTRPFAAADADQIRCKTLVIDSEQEGFFAGQPKKLFDRLTCEKTLMHLPISQALGAHCQAGAESAGSQRIYDWLDEALDVT